MKKSVRILCLVFAALFLLSGLVSLLINIF